MVILHLFSSRCGEPDDKQRQIMVIPHIFCHPDTIVSDGTQRQIMVILRLVSARIGEPNDMQIQIMIILRPFVIQRQRAR